MTAPHPRQGPGPPQADLVIDGCAIATVDPAGREFTSGHIVVAGGKIAAIGPARGRPVPASAADRRFGLPRHTRAR